ncbi:MAG: medium chain dehydrogenase/reductase family protein [Elusimicrobia bacterium]|nr:medium chain dehydrogenase/reductase family protein [Elusimicrobiota bacterium]
MKAVFIVHFGGPRNLQVREVPEPAPGRGEVRIRVRAAGVNFADALMRMGMYPGAPKLPFVPGYEVAGVVDAVGAAVKAWKEGDRVLAATNYGGYSEAVVVKERQAFPIPVDKDFDSAAALAVNYITAYIALVVQANARPGESLFVHGAAGGVGVAAVQLGKLLGLAPLFGTASASKHDFLRREGVAHPIDHRTEDFEEAVRRLTGGRGVDIVMDPVGGESFKKSYRLLAPLGRLICYGFSGAAAGRTRSLLRLGWEFVSTPRFSPTDLMLENRAVFGLHLGRLTGNEKLLGDAMGRLLQWWKDEKISPVVGATFKLEEAGKAHAYLQDRKNIGKVVLVV